MSHRINITRIKAVYNALGSLQNQVVFLGGATVSLYADREAPDVRPTDDIDILVEISSRWKYAAIEEQLRKMGFQNDINSKFLGRYLLPGLIIDVMPTNEAILGFSNIWYSKGFKNAIDYKIDEQHIVKILDPAYFIATKLEAFKNRGHNDGRTSSDFEDIVFVLENRSTIWEEMKDVTSNLKQYLKNEFTKLRNNPNIDEWIDAHFDFSSPSGSNNLMKKLIEFLA